jgi:serine/threonine-protein kinase
VIAFHILGTIDLRKGDVSLATILAQPKRLGLLAYLAAARPRGFQPRDRLLALFWPEADDERARTSLRQALHQLRRTLGEDAIPGRGDREVGIDHALIWCDAVAFDDAIAAGRREEALELYRGDFLPGLFVQEAPEVERWIEEERSFRRRKAAEAAGGLAVDAERAGDAMAAAKWARRATEIEPGDEASLRRLLVVLDRAGDTAGALAAYDDFARRLERDFGAAPSEETNRLVSKLREQRPRVESASIRRASLEAPRGAGTPPGTEPEPMPIPLPVAIPDTQPASERRRRLAPWLIGTAIMAIAIGAFGVWRARSAATALPTEPSIAVLPFVNMSADPANEFLSDGMTEELLNLLAQVPGIQVAARTSSFFYKGKNLPVDSIGRAMRVHNVLEGSVRQSGNRVRITAQLIDARTGYHLWSDSFERSLEDVFAVQDSIGRAIVRVLKPRLASGPSGVQPPERREPPDPDAHIATMKGWRAFRVNTREAYVAAVDHFQEAIRRDPEYGYALAGLATVRHWQAYLRHLPPDSAYTEARALANRALALDSSLVDGWLVLGRLAEVVDRNYPLALSHFARAVAVAPSDPRAYNRQAVLLAYLGRQQEALAAARRGVELDPASPATYAALGQLYAALDRHPEAEAALRQALTLDPGHPILLGNLALSLTKQRRFDEAEPIILEARRKAPRDATFIGQHAFIASRIGKTQQARALLDTAEAAGASPVSLAATWHSLGDTARVLDLLERAVRERDDGVTFVLDTMAFHSLRRHPRYQRLVAEVRAGSRARDR